MLSDDATYLRNGRIIVKTVVIVEETVVAVLVNVALFIVRFNDPCQL